MISLQSIFKEVSNDDNKGAFLLAVKAIINFIVFSSLLSAFLFFCASDRLNMWEQFSKTLIVWQALTFGKESFCNV